MKAVERKPIQVAVTNKKLKVLFNQESRGTKSAIIDRAGARWFIDLCANYPNCYGFTDIAETKHHEASDKRAYELYSNGVEFMPYDLAEAMGLLDESK